MADPRRSVVACDHGDYRDDSEVHQATLNALIEFLGLNEDGHYPPEGPQEKEYYHYTQLFHALCCKVKDVIEDLEALTSRVATLEEKHPTYHSHGPNGH